MDSASFRATGLCPLDPDSPDYASKCLDIDQETDEQNPIVSQSEANEEQRIVSQNETNVPLSGDCKDYATALKVIEKNLGGDIFNVLKNHRDPTVADLYQLYNQIEIKSNKNNV